MSDGTEEGAQSGARPTLRERLAAERREELIDAALTTFARRGYHATSLKEIAAAAGVTDGLLIHYFGTKLNLLRAVLAERQSLAETIERIVEEAPDDDAAAALRHVVAGWLAALQNRQRSLIGILISEARANPEVAEALTAHSYRTLQPTERLLARLAARGLIRDEHLPVAARMLQWSVVWYSFWREIAPAESQPPEMEEWIDGLTSILLSGIAQ
jgi:AcrR family transcriptional regulator